MLKTYRILSYIVNSLFVIGLLITAFEELFRDTQGFSMKFINILIPVILLLAAMAGFYMVIKTRKTYYLTPVRTYSTLDSDFHEEVTTRFKLDKLTCISNILFGILIIGFFVTIMIIKPIQFRFLLYGGELLRLLIFVFSIFYGCLQVHYSIRMLMLLKVGNTQS